MLTVPQAAIRAAKNPETIRRWIREGRLPYSKFGTQYLIDETALDAVLEDAEILPAAPEWDETATGEPMPNWVALVRRERAEH